MIPRFRAWDKKRKKLGLLEADMISGEFQSGKIYDDEDVDWMEIEEFILMQSTGLKDKNGQEIFEGDILKFNDEWPEYCYEGYVDGSVDGFNYVEIKAETTCFAFGKTRIPESSLTDLVENEHYHFEELVNGKSYEFEVIGNIWENPELLEADHDRN